MKKIFFLFCVSLIFHGYAQTSNFKSATLTAQDGQTQEVFFKNKQYIVDNKGNLNIYSEPDNQSQIFVTGKDFSTIETDNNNIFIISASINKLDVNQPVILRKLVSGNHSLFVHVDSNGEQTYINKSNGNFTILGKYIDDKSEEYFKKWLYEKLNPLDHKVSYYNNMKYNTEDLVEYYTKNQKNTLQYLQEEQVKYLNANLQAGFISNSISGSLINSDNDTSFRIGVQGQVNLDPVKNRHSVIFGLAYYTTISGSGVENINPQSINPQFNRIVETDITLNMFSFHFGYQHNFHFNQISVSPYVSLEPSFLYSDTRVESVLQEDGELFFLTKADIKNPFSYNLGLKISFFENYFLAVEYNYIPDITFQGPVIPNGINLLNYNMSQYYLGIGYKFL